MVKTTPGSTTITQVDGLGRIATTCEISSNGSMPGTGTPGDCGLDIPGTGFKTTYAYDLPNHTTTVNQGVQVRVFQTDSIGRTISVQEPESGQTNYSYAYNSTGLVVTRTRPRANQSNPATMTTTITQYDAVNRAVSVTYNDSVTSNKSFFYDAPGKLAWTQTGLNLKGRLAVMGAILGSSSPTNTSAAFSYDAMGRVVNLWQCAPSTCGTANQGNRPQAFTYDWLGNVLTSTDGTGVKDTYSYTPANEVLSITNSVNDATHPPNLVSGVQNGPFGPTSWQLGNGLTGVNTYDGAGRKNGGWACRGSSQAYCTGGTQAYGFNANWQGSFLNASCDSALGQCSNYGYDEFSRLKSRTVTTGTPANYTYVYDRWGNRWQQNALNGGPAPQLSFITTNNRVTGYAYDAAGNVTNDGLHTYTYDAEGNQTAVDGTTKYTYDALNRRVRIDRPTNSKEFVFNAAGQRASIWNVANGYPQQRQTYWGATAVEFDQNNYAQFQHQDWQGTERVRTKYDGSVDGTLISLPFGDAASATGNDNDAYHFAMLDHDYGTTNDHAQFREYGETAGRWLAPDPYLGSYDLTNPQSLNRYSYVLNSPVSFIDPFGLDCTGNQDITVYSGGGVSYGPVNITSCSGSGGFGNGGNYDGPGALIYLGGRTRGGGKEHDPPSKNVFTCASEAAGKVSIAGGLHALGIGKSGVGGFITNALGGNVFSGATDLISSIANGSAGGHSVFYNMGQSVVAGPRQGIPGGTGALGASAAGLASDAIAGGIHAGISAGGELTTLAGTASTVGLTGAEYASGVGEIKFAYDAVTFAGSLVGCKLGVIH